VRFIADTRRRRNEIFILIEVVMDRFIAQSGMRNIIFQTDNNDVIKIVKSPKKFVF
jgi:rRNA pseudouridine-1189 N-methylase Emg1 (Nep1/Mra1 family)